MTSDTNELLPVAMHGHPVPLAQGTCTNCGTALVYNLRGGVCQHTADTDCVDPDPAPNPT